MADDYGWYCTLRQPVPLTIKDAEVHVGEDET